IEIGPPALAAVPTLLEELAAKKDDDREARTEILYALSVLAPKDPATVRALETAQKDDDVVVRAVANGAMGRVTPEGEEIVAVASIAIEAFATEAREYAFDAARKLVCYGPAAKEAVPTLLAIRAKAGEPMHTGLSHIIRRIDPAAIKDGEQNKRP